MLITDGEESCGGDFTAATAALKAAGVDLQLNIVGFTLTDAKASQPLAAMAGATAIVPTAKDGAALTRALVAATLTRFPYTVYAASGGHAGTGSRRRRPESCPPATTSRVHAGDQDLVVENVSIAPGRDAAVTIVRKGDGFALNAAR